MRTRCHSADVSLARVARRVAGGGHNIPPDVLRRRYSAGLRNMRQLYLPLADTAAVYDNTDGNLRLIAEKSPGLPLTIADQVIWASMENLLE